MLLNDINFDGAERKAFRDCVKKLWDQGKSETLMTVGESTVYGTDESEEDEEEVEGKVLGCGSDEISVMPIVYPRGMISVSSLGYFSSIGSSYKPSNP